MPNDYYSILGVDRDASARVIHRAFRRLALLYYPDVNREPGAVDTFKKVNQGYQVLSDERQRESYNHFWDNSPYAERARHQRSGRSSRIDQAGVGAQQPNQSSRPESPSTGTHRQTGEDSPRAGEGGQGPRGRQDSSGTQAESKGPTAHEIRKLNRAGCIIALIALAFIVVSILDVVT